MSARCDRATAISVNGLPVAFGAARDILDFDAAGKARVEVEFLIDGRVQSRTVTMTAGDEQREVTCDGA